MPRLLGVSVLLCVFLLQDNPGSVLPVLAGFHPGGCVLHHWGALQPGLPGWPAVLHPLLLSLLTQSATGG